MLYRCLSSQWCDYRSVMTFDGRPPLSLSRSIYFLAHSSLWLFTAPLRSLSNSSGFLSSESTRNFGKSTRKYRQKTTNWSALTRNLQRRLFHILIVQVYPLYSSLNIHYMFIDLISYDFSEVIPFQSPQQGRTLYYRSWTDHAICSESFLPIISFRWLSQCFLCTLPVPELSRCQWRNWVIGHRLFQNQSPNSGLNVFPNLVPFLLTVFPMLDALIIIFGVKSYRFSDWHAFGGRESRFYLIPEERSSLPFCRSVW